MSEIAEEDEDDLDRAFEEDDASSMDVSVSVSKMVSRLEVLRRRILRDQTAALSNSNSPQDSNIIQRQLDSLVEIKRLRAQADTSRRSSIFPTRETQVRLPKIDLAKFSGDIIKWPEFWDSFESAIDRNESLQAVEKLNYLRSKLQGEALTTIEGLQTTNENYEVALQLLKSRYGNTQVLITTHYSKMMDLAPSPNTTSKIRLLHDELERHLRCLEALGEDTTHRHFVSLIMARLPWQVVSKLEESKDEEESWTVELLRKRLRAHLNARETGDRQCPERMNTARSGYSTYSSTARNFPRKPTAETLFAGARERVGPTKTVETVRCVFCQGTHWSDECRRYSTLETRKKAVRGRCFICLSDKHLLKNCSSTKKPCWHCKRIGNHHRSLCPKRHSVSSETSNVIVDKDNSGVDYSSASREELHVDDVLLASGEKVLLQTALCSIKSKETTAAVRTRILPDSGSHRSYISERLAKKLKLSPVKSETISIVTFGAERPKTVETKLCGITLVLKDGSVKTISVNIVPKITGNISRIPVALDDSSFLWKDIPLADTLPKESELTTIDCLLGNDYYLELITADRIQVREGLYLLGSKFGWILTGRTGQQTEEPDTSILVMTHTNYSVPDLCRQPRVDSCLQVNPSMEDFWSLESIGIRDCPQSSDDQKAVKDFEDAVSFQDGRYYVSWPWREPTPDLPQNFELAYGRFRSTVRRLSQDEYLFLKYSQVIRDQEACGVIEKVTEPAGDSADTLKHYIPHHPVITPKKVRIVYDASAKARKCAKSLNECLLRGPVMLQNLCGLLLRFRLHKIVILADIEKAFLQIGIHVSDRDVTRFFWLKDTNRVETENNVQLYRFRRVPFGVISSPFLLASTISHHLKKSGSPFAEELLRNMYVDNIVSGAEDTTSAKAFYRAAKGLMNEASMNLREWTSNSKELLDFIPATDQMGVSTVKLLGLQWNTKTDKVQITVQRKEEKDFVLTKREVIREMARSFDPLGYFVPVTLGARLFVQKLWKEVPDWDQTLSQDQQNQWEAIRAELRMLPRLQLERYISAKKAEVCNVLCFCDASCQAYAAVVYLHYGSDVTWHTSLVFGKSRVAPKDRLSIPRMELMGVLIGVRCLKFVEQELDLSFKKVSLD